jgi:hypothetical protein
MAEAQQAIAVHAGPAAAAAGDGVVAAAAALEGAAGAGAAAAAAGAGAGAEAGTMPEGEEGAGELLSAAQQQGLVALAVDRRSHAAAAVAEALRLRSFRCCPPACLPLTARRQPARLSARLPASLPACLPACLPARPPACLPACPPACLPACLPLTAACLHARPPACCVFDSSFCGCGAMCPSNSACLSACLTRVHKCHPMPSLPVPAASTCGSLQRMGCCPAVMALRTTALACGCTRWAWASCHILLRQRRARQVCVLYFQQCNSH